MNSSTFSLCFLLLILPFSIIVRWNLLTDIAPQTITLGENCGKLFWGNFRFEIQCLILFRMKLNIALARMPRLSKIEVFLGGAELNSCKLLLREDFRNSFCVCYCTPGWLQRWKPSSLPDRCIIQLVVAVACSLRWSSRRFQCNLT